MPTVARTAIVKRLGRVDFGGGRFKRVPQLTEQLK